MALDEWHGKMHKHTNEYCTYAYVLVMYTHIHAILIYSFEAVSSVSSLCKVALLLSSLPATIEPVPKIQREVYQSFLSINSQYYSHDMTMQCAVSQEAIQFAWCSCQGVRKPYNM